MSLLKTALQANDQDVSLKHEKRNVESDGKRVRKEKFGSSCRNSAGALQPHEVETKNMKELQHEY